MAGAIEQYLAAVRRTLDFDPALACRVASEAEMHLRDAAEADPDWPSPEAEQRAVARFGTVHEITAEFAFDAAERQAVRTWLALSATVVVTFLAMRLRVLWLDGRTGILPELAPLIDRYAFLASLVVGAVGWFAFRRSPVLLMLCFGGLAASIVAGLLRAGLFAEGAPLAVLLTSGAEIGLMVVLSGQIAGFFRRVRHAETLRRMR